jgi:hypothetical protein
VGEKGCVGGCVATSHEDDLEVGLNMFHHLVLVARQGLKAVFQIRQGFYASEGSLSLFFEAGVYAALQQTVRRRSPSSSHHHERIGKTGQIKLF